MDPGLAIGTHGRNKQILYTGAEHDYLRARHKLQKARLWAVVSVVVVAA